MILDIVFLVIMCIAAVWAVMARSLLKSAIGLACVSMIISMFMFKFDCPIAGVFELSVCAGLITVIFLSTISLTRPLTQKEMTDLTRRRTRRYGFLPIIVILAGTLSIGLINLPLCLKLIARVTEPDARNVLWGLRQLDLLGHVIILLAGGFGAVILFKEIKADEW